MKFKRALLYVGPPKTGSTSIQSFVWSTRDALIEQGFYTPKAGRLGSQHMALAALSEFNARGKRRTAVNQRVGGGESDADLLEQRRSLFLKNLDLELAEARPGHTLFFMSESLFVSDSDGIRAYRDALSKYAPRLECLMYLRRQDQWLGSRSLQRRKQAEGDLLPLEGSPTQFANTVRDWYAECDQANIRRLDSSFLKNGSLIQDFCDAAGLEPTALDTTEIRKNTALLQEQVELVDAFNARIGSIPFRKRITFRSKFLALCTETLAGSRIEFPRELAKQIFNSFDEVNTWLCRTIDPEGPPQFFNAEFDLYPENPENAARYSLDQLTTLLKVIAPTAEPAENRDGLIEQLVVEYVTGRMNERGGRAAIRRP